MVNDGKIPNYLNLLVFLFFGLFLIQWILFSEIFKIGIFVSLSLIFYFGFFLLRDKNLKKKKSDRFFNSQKTWFKYRDEKLPKNIP